MPNENKIRDAADAVRGVAEAVPVYQDVVQPAAREIGTALQTVAKCVHVALAPVSGLVWGYDKIKDYLNETLTQKLKDVPKERIVPPNPTVAGPAVEALRFAAHDPSLRELYANLLATSMDAKTAEEAHPAFVEIIRQLTPDEARLMKFFARGGAFPLLTVRAKAKNKPTGTTILRHFSTLGYEAGCEHPSLAQTYIDNLCRLGLILIPPGVHSSKHALYDALVKHPSVKNILATMPERYPEHEPQYVLEGLWLTNLGRQFSKACIEMQAHVPPELKKTSRSKTKSKRAKKAKA